ncbi:MAG: RNA polymerase sigma-70 factor [Bacteroidetes bacterium]|nr:RNA polymerase sigma-70 factor [Bacteroidota bacterium]
MIAATRIKYLQNRIAKYSDQYAYKELFTSLYSYLYHFAFSFIKSKQSAEEILSDVFIKIWEKRTEMDEIANLKVYLYVATRNTALNYVEKQKRDATHNIDEFTAGIKSLYFDPEQLMVTAEMMNLIQKAIDDLPIKCRMVFKLVKEDGMKYREVAEIMDISTKTVENQLAIALRKIGSAVDFDIKRTIPAMGHTR